MSYFKYNKKNQVKESSGNRSSFMDSIVPDTNRWTPGEGKFNIRIMPPWSEEGIIAKKIQVLYKAGKDELTFITPEFFERDTCPFVHAHKEIRSHMGSDEWELYKDDINLVRPVNRWYANVVVSNELSKGVQVWGFGKKCMDQITSITDTGDYGDVTDPEDGTNLLLTLTPDKFGLVPIIHAVRDMSPLADMNWLEQIYDLDDIWVAPDLEEVKRAYESLSFSVWTPPYLYAEEDDTLPDHTPEDNNVTIYNNDPEFDSLSVAEMETHVPTSVDEVTGAPTNIPPVQTSPPTRNIKSSYEDALGFEAKMTEDLKVKIADRLAQEATSSTDA